MANFLYGSTSDLRGLEFDHRIGFLIADIAGGDEQMFGAKQQVLHAGGSDKEAESVITIGDEL
jgi:hypothetical protein